jgi:hypothetical protein
MGAYLSVTGSEGDAAAPTPIWVSLVPTDPNEFLDTPGEFGGYAEHYLDQYCKNECERSYVVVARLIDPSTAVSTDITVDLSAPYSSDMSSPRPPAGMNLALRLDPTVVPVASTSLRSKQSGVLELVSGTSQSNDERFVDTWRGELRVAREAISDASGNGFPLTGRIVVHGTTTAQDRDAGADLALRIDDLWLATGYPTVSYEMLPMETDWLRLCPGDDDCVLPVELELQGDQSLSFEFELIGERAPQEARRPRGNPRRRFFYDRNVAAGPGRLGSDPIRCRAQSRALRGSPYGDGDH